MEDLQDRLEKLNKNLEGYLEVNNRQGIYRIKKK